MSTPELYDFFSPQAASRIGIVGDPKTTAFFVIQGAEARAFGRAPRAKYLAVPCRGRHLNKFNFMLFSLLQTCPYQPRDINFSPSYRLFITQAGRRALAQGFLGLPFYNYTFRWYLCSLATAMKHAAEPDWMLVDP